MNTVIAKLVRELQFRSPFRRDFFPRYAYNFAPPQLIFLCQCIEATRNVPGCIVEVGCFNGSGTVFLNKHMDAIGVEKLYFALDTFTGFVPDDVRVEVSERGKPHARLNGFQANKQKWFDATMRLNNISRVRSIAADVNIFDFSPLGPIAFALLDVDLYRPTANTLPRIYNLLSPGGIVVVDDCTDGLFDGAKQAYLEFTDELGVPMEIACSKLGVIRKPPKSLGTREQ